MVVRQLRNALKLSKRYLTGEAYVSGEEVCNAIDSALSQRNPKLESWLREWKRAEREGFEVHLTPESIKYYVKVLEDLNHV